MKLKSHQGARWDNPVVRGMWPTGEIEQWHIFGHIYNSHPNVSTEHEEIISPLG